MKRRDPNKSFICGLVKSSRIASHSLVLRIPRPPDR